jgi:hypothetical protein
MNRLAVGTFDAAVKPQRRAGVGVEVAFVLVGFGKR